MVGYTWKFSGKFVEGKIKLDAVDFVCLFKF